MNGSTGNWFVMDRLAVNRRSFENQSNTRFANLLKMGERTARSPAARMSETWRIQGSFTCRSCSSRPSSSRSCSSSCGCSSSYSSGCPSSYSNYHSGYQSLLQFGEPAEIAEKDSGEGDDCVIHKSTFAAGRCGIQREAPAERSTQNNRVV